MKNFISIISIAILGAILLISCGNDNLEEPTKELKLSKTEVSFMVDEISKIKITSGNGDYKTTSNDIVKAIIKDNEIILTGLKKGETKISVTDAKNKITEISVKVDQIKELKLSDTAISFVINETKKIKITSGNGDYKVNSNDIVKAIVNDNEITLTGLKKGETKISVTDAKNKIAEISVKVKGIPFSYPIKNIVLVEGGTFKMKDPDNNKVQDVTLSTFKISKYEVTNSEYAKFLNKIGASIKGNHNNIEYIYIGYGCDVVYKDNKFIAKTDKENNPVALVTWAGANAFAKEVGGSLPTEAQWEYAARGGKKSKNYTYSGSNTINDVSWNKNNSTMKTHTIGKKKANELGLYDMSGNLWEWCSDWYGNYNDGLQKNPKGPSSGSYRIFRGGAYNDQYPITFRNRLSPKYAYPAVGFRLVFPQ